MRILAAVLLVGCASSPPATKVDPRLDAAAIARALAPELWRTGTTIRLDSAELLYGRSRCGTERRVHCDPDQHPALLTALSRELSAEIVAYSDAMFCPEKELPCIPRGEIALVKVGLPVLESSGIMEIAVSSSIAADESVHEHMFIVLLRCHAGQCTVVGRRTLLVG